MNALRPTTLSGLVVGMLLFTVLSTHGMKVCIGDDAAQDCCPEAPMETPGLELSPCDCCIDVDAAPSCASSSPLHFDATLGSGPGKPVRPAVACVSRASDGHPDSRLTCLATTVLVI